MFCSLVCVVGHFAVVVCRLLLEFVVRCVVFAALGFAGCYIAC